VSKLNLETSCLTLSALIPQKEAKDCIAQLFIIGFLLVLSLGQTVCSLRAVEEPSFGIDLGYGGDLVLSSVESRIVAMGSDLRVINIIYFESKGLTPSFSLVAMGHGVGLENVTQMSIVVGGFYIWNPNGTRSTHVYLPGGFAQLNWPVTVVGSKISYSVDLASFIQDSQRTFLSREGLTMDTRSVVATGQIRVDFVAAEGVGSIGGSKFFDMMFSCTFKGARANFDVTVTEPESRFRQTRIGNSSMEQSSPTHAAAQFTVNSAEPTTVYVEWETAPQPPWWTMQPFDWVISGLVGVVITGIAAVLTKKIAAKPGKKKQG